jgi:excisionase family DNA binding protein
MSISNLPKFLTTDQAAELLTVSASTLEVWRYRRTGPRFVKIGRSVRYRQSDVEAFIEERVRASQQEPAAAR